MNPATLRNRPTQQRARRRVDEIRAAARAILGEVGRDRFTTDLVAARAGCSIGTIYRYFEDRVALLDDLYPNRCDGLDCPRTHADWGRA